MFYGVRKDGLCLECKNEWVELQGFHKDWQTISQEERNRRNEIIARWVREESSRRVLEVEADCHGDGFTKCYKHFKELVDKLLKFETEDIEGYI